jgi:hypothetical protein
LIDRGLQATAALWEPVRVTFAWLHTAARILDNATELSGAQVRRRLLGLCGAMQRWRSRAGDLAPAVEHFVKVTRSYGKGLFHCYVVPDLPRTNNALEQLFGSYRHHERRITGRKAATPALVVRGSVRIIAAVVTQVHTFAASDLAPRAVADWRTLRDQLEQRRHLRVLQRRFRQDPQAYLVNLEEQLLKLILPA